MMELFQSMFHSGINAVFALISLTPVLIMLVVCIVYFLLDAVCQYRNRRRLL